MNTTAPNTAAMSTTRTLSTPRQTRVAALALSTFLTLAMLVGVNGLAVHEAGIAVMAQSSASQG